MALNWQAPADTTKGVSFEYLFEEQSPAMIVKEITAHLLAYNLVCGLMARAAAARQVVARALSAMSV